VAVEVAVLETGLGLLGADRGEGDLDLAGVLGVGLELERGAEIPAADEAVWGLGYGFDFSVTAHDDIWWDATTIDDPIARQILDELYRRPDTVDEGVAAHFGRFDQQGLRVVTNDDGFMRPAAPEELGIAGP
jgi:hypothetical protein